MTTAPVFTAVTFALSADRVVSSANPVIAAGGVNAEICAAVKTTGTEAAARACPSDGSLVSIDDKELFPVV